MKDFDKKEFFRPVIVLSCICFVATLALALTNFVSSPVIAANTEKAAVATRKALLADADDFTSVTDTMDLTSETGKATVTDVYTANNGAGAVFTVETGSFGGTLTMMVGIDKDGEITGVEVTDHEDTPGVGTKNFVADYLGQYTGLTALNTQNVKKENVQTQSGAPFAFISGASVTGTALHAGVYEALAKYAMLH